MAQILLVRSKEGEPVAAVMTFFFKDQVVPFWAGSRFEYRKLAPNLSPANPKYKKIIEIWRKLPLAATKIIGPRIAKYLA